MEERNLTSQRVVRREICNEVEIFLREILKYISILAYLSLLFLYLFIYVSLSISFSFFFAFFLISLALPFFTQLRYYTFCLFSYHFASSSFPLLFSLLQSVIFLTSPPAPSLERDKSFSVCICVCYVQTSSTLETISTSFIPPFPK